MQLWNNDRNVTFKTVDTYPHKKTTLLTIKLTRLFDFVFVSPSNMINWLIMFNDYDKTLPRKSRVRGCLG